MPYIKDRDRLRCKLETPGDLNFAISDLVDDYILYNNDAPSYATINTVVGALECAKLELYRRLAAPYEDRKMKQNGDVYYSAPLFVEADQDNTKEDKGDE